MSPVTPLIPPHINAIISGFILLTLYLPSYEEMGSPSKEELPFYEINK
jgi:hypothetical protein